MFDVKKRKSLKGVTVGELVQIMLDLPQEAIVNFCGSNNGFIHVEKDDSKISFDTDVLGECYEDEYW